MSQDEDPERFEAAVRAEVARRTAEAQARFAEQVEQAVKSALKGLDDARDALAMEREALAGARRAFDAEREQARRERADETPARVDGDRGAPPDSGPPELLRGLARSHLKAGRPVAEIVDWLQVPEDFVEEIRWALERAASGGAGWLERDATLRYEGTGRGGTIRFESSRARFDMWWEFAADPALVIIGVPGTKDWERCTGLPLAERDPVLQFVAARVVREKTNGSHAFDIADSTITIFQ